MKFSSSSLEFAIDDSHLVLVDLSNLFIEKEPEAVVMRLGQGEVVKGPDLLIEQGPVATINGAHLVRRIQCGNDHHNRQRRQGDEHLGADLEVRQKTHLYSPLRAISFEASQPESRLQNAGTCRLPITQPEVIGNGREIAVSTVSLTFVPRATSARIQANEEFSPLFKVAHFKGTTSCRLHHNSGSDSRQMIFSNDLPRVNAPQKDGRCGIARGVARAVRPVSVT